VFSRGLTLVGITHRVNAVLPQLYALIVWEIASENFHMKFPYKIASRLIFLAITSYCQRCHAGWPSFTATKSPVHVAVILLLTVSVASTRARSAWLSVIFASNCKVLSSGVGRSSLTVYSAVTVQDGVCKLLFCIKCMAADQLQWQSKRLPMIPPLIIPGNAWCSSRHWYSALYRFPS